MAFSEISGYNIQSVVAVTAPTVEDNAEILGEESLLFEERTGIKTRFIENNQHSIFQYFLQAASKILLQNDLSSSDIQVLICITQTPDIPFPNLSNRLQHALNLSTETICFDVNLGCSGYVYGIFLCQQLLASIQGKNALLLTGDISTLFIPTSHINLRPLFSDAVSATLIGKSDTHNFFNLMSHGSGNKAIYAKADGQGNYHMEMQGLDVFNYSFQYVAQSINSLFKKYDTQLPPCSERLYVLHQANKMILESIRKQLKANENQFLYSLENFGNTAIASIPITLALHQEIIKGKQVVLSGFGVGFSIGVCVTAISNHCHFEITQYED
jgi:3-oxoacyl-[acyl-carrier-protein] synthase III